MKLAIAAVLLTLTTPALAAKWSAVPKAVQSDITKWEDLHGTCNYGLLEKNPNLEEICNRAEVLRKKLIAKGYCPYGHGVVGKMGGKGRCFAFDRQS